MVASKEQWTKGVNGMLARELMHKEVVTVTPDTSLAAIASLMVDHHLDGLPVVHDDGGIVGIISATDFLRLLLPNPVKFLDVNLYLGAGRLHQELMHEIADMHAEDLMTRTLHTVEADTPLHKVVSIMGEHRVRHVPVVEDGRLLGLIHRIDVVRLFSHWLSEEAPDD